MPDVADQLRKYFDATAPSMDDHLTQLSPEPGATEAFGPQSRPGRARFAVAAIWIVLAGVAGFVAVQSVNNSTDYETLTADPAQQTESLPVDSDPESSRPSDSVGTTLEWELGEVPSSDPDTFRQLLTDGKTLYWIGDAMYSSTDGVIWTEVIFDDVEPSLLELGMIDNAWAGQLAISAASGGTVAVELIGVDGSIKSETLLPSLEPDVYSIVEISDPVVTVGSRGVLVAARLSVLDFRAVVEAVLGGEAEAVTSVRIDEGAEFETLIVRTASRTERIVLSENGVVDSHEVEVAPSGTIGWHSPDGQTWTPIPAKGPFGVDGRLETSLTATTAGFVGITTDGTGWFSSDGGHWTEIDGLPPTACCERLVPWTGRALAWDAAGGLGVLDKNGFTDLFIDGLPPRSTFSRSFSAGEVGIGYLADIDPDAGTFQVVYSPDGISWEAQLLPDMVGDLYCCYLDVYGTVVGREHVAVLALGDSGLQLWLASPTAQEDS